MKNRIIKILSSVLFLIISMQIGFSQVHQCGAVFTEDDSRRIFEKQRQLRTQVKKSNNAALSMGLRIHIIRNDSGNGGLTTAQINTAVNQLNIRFDPVNISFTKCVTNYIDDNKYFNATIPTSGSLFNSLVNEAADENLVNIYFVPDFTAAGIAMPWEDFIVIHNDYALNSRTLGHEMGHFLGLLHTHETGKGIENPTRDDTDTSCYNCESAGDGFCDTNADPYSLLVSAGYEPMIAVHPEHCFGVPFEIQGSCPAGEEYTVPASNLMSYYEYCMSTFSQSQKDFMRAWRDGPLRSSIYDSCSGQSSQTCTSTMNGYECGGQCIPCHCYDNVQNNNEYATDCGGPCPFICTNGPAFYYCESGCQSNLTLNCSALESEEWNGTIVMNNAQITNQNNYAIEDLRIQVSLVGEGTEIILATSTGTIITLDDIPANQTVTASIPFFYTPQNINGAYKVIVRLIDVNMSCESSNTMLIGDIPSCYDGIFNQNETGVDCGGICQSCTNCYDGIKNQGEIGVDCGGPCSPCPTCNDEIKNQGELGIDCGGPCSACPSCDDGIQNQYEEGIDCGGPCHPCNTCPENLHLNQINTADVYKANNTVSCDGPIVVNNGAVTFNGGQKVDLLPGFLADANDGYYFEAENKDCDSNQKQSVTEIKEVIFDVPKTKVEKNPIIDLIAQDPIEKDVTGFEIGNYPNPFSKETILELTLNQSKYVSIYITDMNGRLINKLKEREFMTEGNYQFSFIGNNYQPGIYYYSVIAGDEKKILKMILIE